ncbi:MAG: hypothetical protein EOO47_20450, partial [Flavobacterium sp.]
MPVNMEMPCPCGSGNNYSNCCQPYHQNTTLPPTPEALMRSRYTAYTMNLADYLLATTHPSQRKFYAKADIENWATQNKWLRLEICQTIDDVVTFKAYYEHK